MFSVILDDVSGRRELIGRTDDESVAMGAAQWLAKCGHRVIVRSGDSDTVYGA